MDFPKSVPSVGLVDGKFVDENIAEGTPGSLIPSAWGNSITTEVLNVIQGAGFAPNENDLTQLIKAIRKIAQAPAGNFAVDTGVANAYAATYAPAVTAVAEGLRLHFRANHSNTADSTFTPAHGLIAPAPICSVDFLPLIGGEIPLYGQCTVVYSTASDKWVLTHAIPAATLSTAGRIQLASNGEVSAGVNSSKAVTPSGAKAVYAPLNNPAFTGVATGLTKSMVGLANADNTSDANKPVSSPQQTALNLKAPISNPSFVGTLTAETIAVTASSIGGTGIYAPTPSDLGFATANVYRGKFDGAGSFLVGVVSAPNSTIKNNTAEGGIVLDVYGNTGASTFRIRSTGAMAANAAAAGLQIGNNTVTGRSINAGGTVNTAGADYAEYMRKNAAFDIAKGDIAGTDKDGLLTNKFSEAISFMVKSTNPSYVGGDTWGVDVGAAPTEPVSLDYPPQPIRPKPLAESDYVAEPVPPASLGDDPSEDEIAEHELQLAEYAQSLEAYEASLVKIAAFEQAQAHYVQEMQVFTAAVSANTEAYNSAYLVFQTEMEAFQVRLELERMKVDRMAFAGQVPVNVLGAKPGDFIVPDSDGELIIGTAVSCVDLTFEQYRRAVGIVQNVLPDGRANIRVKVA